jgi:hypothetical protein
MSKSVDSKNPVTRGVSHGVVLGDCVGGLDTPHALPQSDDCLGLGLVQTRNVMYVGVATVASRRTNPHFHGATDGLNEDDRTLHAKVRSVYDDVTHFFTSFFASRYWFLNR